jgi:putative lipoic acid-binding regulatory protein
MINNLEGSTERDFGKYKCSVLEAHIPHKNARNIIKSSKGKYKSMRAKVHVFTTGSTYVHFWKCKVFDNLQDK